VSADDGKQRFICLSFENRTEKKFIFNHFCKGIYAIVYTALKQNITFVCIVAVKV
jgi:hypothetical protein